MKRLALILMILLVWAMPVSVWAAATTIAAGKLTGTSGISTTGNTSHNLVRLSSGRLIAAFLDETNNVLRMYYSDNNGSTWTQFSGTAPAAYGVVALATDGTNWYCAWKHGPAGATYDIYCAYGSGSGTPSYSAGGDVGVGCSGAYPALDIAVDANTAPFCVHICHSNGPGNIAYVNNVGQTTWGNWNSDVQVVSVPGDAESLHLAVDTTSAHTNRYNLPQVVGMDTSGKVYAYIGTANNAMSFDGCNLGLTNPATGCGFAIDSSGNSNITWRNTSNNAYGLQMTVSQAISNWNTASNWSSFGGILTDGYVTQQTALLASGTNLYMHSPDSAYTSRTLRYVQSTNDGSTWGSAQTIETSIAVVNVSPRWQYANNPSYSSSGYEYLIDNGTNVYYDTFAAAAPAPKGGGWRYILLRHLGLDRLCWLGAGKVWALEGG